MIFVLLIVVTITLVIGCGIKKNVVADRLTNGYWVEGYDGNIVYLPKKPKHIITYSLTFDTLVLGLVPPDRLVMANCLDDDPQISYIADATKDIKVKMKNFGIFSAEFVVKMQPDIIILPDSIKPEAIKTFRDLGFPVLVCKTPNDIEDVQKDIILISKALGEEQAGNRVIAEMHKQLQEIDEVLKKQKTPMPVGMLVSRMTNYGGKGSMFDILCNRAHIINGIAKAGLKQGDFLPKEAVVKADPDFFMISGAHNRADYNITKNFTDDFLGDPALKNLKGLQKIVSIPERYLYSNSQNCVYAIKGLANYAYGDLFDLSNEHLIKGY